MHHIVWLTYTVAIAIVGSLAFNIDTTNPDIYTTEQKDFFRNKVLQIMSDKKKGTLVTAQQQSEETCGSDLNKTHECLIIPDISLTDTATPVSHFGLSIAEDSVHSQFTICSPSVVHEGHEHSYLNSVCYNMTDDLQQNSSFTPAFQDCTEKTVDLVFLFDGSGSMTGDEFNKNKDFIVDIMNNLKNTSVKFAAVQFSMQVKKVFDFNDYEAGRALDKLMKEPHMKALTNTHKALKFVLEEIFENPDAGASPDATKVVVLITDGHPTDTDIKFRIIKRYDDKNIIRIVIGVRNAHLDKFRAIASEPKDQHAYKIENYDGLTGILGNLQKRICKIEGDNEISPGGLSAVFYKICSPSVVHEGHEHSYLNSVCYNMTDDLQQNSSFTPAFQDCTEKTVDLVFLFDGSGSMTGDEFNKNKDFIVDIMNNLKNTSVKFAAVQFSMQVKKVFDFNDYEAGRALDKLMKEPHMKALTNTHKALKFVLEEIFENPDAGASPDATKVVVLITDGHPTDTDIKFRIIKRYDDKNIIRIVIGVRNAHLDKFRAIASEPKDQHAYKIENYDGLTGILGNLQKRICKIEGDNEISPGGLSAVFYKICSPSVVHEGHEHSYLNSVCYNMTDDLQQNSSFTPAFQDCTEKTVDLVFLFDGSGSMTGDEFNKNKDFIVDIMNNLKNTSVKFAAVQFSMQVKKVFDFNDYEAGRALDKLMKEPHMKALTNTHKALKFVLEEIFENPDAGASPDATKVVVLITDGHPTDTDRKLGIIKRYDDKNIIRIVIGVRNAHLDKFRAIASEPKDQHAYKIENYDGLTGILGNLQKRICKIEGDNEISPGGLSAVFYKICSPSVVHEGHEHSYLNSVCYNMTDDLQQNSSFTPAFQDCTEKTVDLVFLFDGSGSMTGDEFNKNKDFIVDIMNNLKNTSVKFAAVQFSMQVKKVFDFNDYEAGRALDKLMKEPHMKALTNTHKALKFVLEEIFENPDAGASPDATKVVVLITDGHPTDTDIKFRIIKRYDDKNIIRIVIGVRNAHLDKFRAIASEPKDQHAYKIENYDGLTGILGNLQKRICKIEGDNEISPGGLSAVFYKICSPSVVHEGHEHSYLNSVCYNMTDDLQQNSSFTPAFQDCTEKTVDLVFLFDGSGSMTGDEFNKNKDFIVDIMNNLKNTSVKFAAVQFSMQVKKVFDFNDYEAGRALDKLMKEPHMKALTNTHKALKFVLEEIFENPDAGASPDATKVVVLITDGHPTDTDKKLGIIKRYDDKNIIRIVIGVRNAHLDKFRAIASEPKDQHAYKIENYDGLTGILGNLQKRICKIEGDNEISPGGLSAVFYKICSPSVVHEGHEHSYLNSVCYNMTDDLQQNSSFTPAFQDCTEKTVDLVFLFDGSGSMTGDEFNKNKDFIVDIMNNLKNTSVKFAAVQFSMQVKKVFDFNDYEAGRALDKLMKEPHMKALTNTHKALKFVLEEIFENPDAGASPDATKVVVLITDGHPTDTDKKLGIIKRYDDKNIIRIVIGVRNAHLDKFRAIASEPKDQHAYKIENYDGLTGILGNLQKRICKIEGDNEISPGGLSAVFYKICSPSVVHEGHEHSYLNSVCYNMTDDLQQNSSFTPAFKDCTEKTVDLVFLFDGSGSMTGDEFNKNKDFIVDIMNNLKNTSVKFAAVQFSMQVKKVFDFNDYEAGRALDKLMKEPHMKALTNTHKALKFVLEEIFENPDAGASPDATKVVVLITDGHPTDTDRKLGIIKRYDDKNIIRIVIGVRNAHLDKFRAIASEPKDQHAYKIENYDGLTGILGNLQKRICKIEGDNEISPGGLSAVFYKICSPSVVHEGHEHSYLNSVCYNMTDDLQQNSSFTPAFQDCTEKTVDLVFLFDGSGSMTGDEFNKNKDFIVDIMNNLKNTSVKFAAVQFSMQVKKVFDFNDYEAGRALDKLMKEPHMKALTNTHKALKFVLEEIFENPDAGASPDATQVVVLITDGHPTDTDKKLGIIKRYDDKNIIRIVIGVRNAHLDKFRAIASEPKDQHAYKIENYDGLTGILGNLQKRICKIEGDNEISPGGLSAVFYKICSPSVVHEGHEHSYLNSVCYNMTDDLQQNSSFTPAFQDCTEKTVDLVFLFDGSGSMTGDEFNKNKDFIVDIMNNLKNTSVKFAAVQFSMQVKKVFDFNDYEAGRALDKLMKEPHMKALTNTHKALKFVLEEIFENPDAGASPDATKVVVLITDGHPTDTDIKFRIIKRYDDKNIIRIVIGVRNAHLDKFRAIASEPKDQHAYKIENYDGLTGILGNLQKRICKIEGDNEISPGGLSAVFYKICSPSVVHEGHEHSYLNSVCYNMTDDLQQNSSFTPAFQDCTEKTVDLVFLFDGSGSMTGDEFNKNKDFIVDIMNNLKNTSVKFAAVQFSMQVKKVFDFNDYEAGRALDKLMKEPHMKALTNTHKALKFVLEEIFENPDAGASPDATKVVVLITDGHPTDTDIKFRIIKRYDDKNIIRIVIGVRNAHLDKFRAIASEPKDQHAYKIENYDGLTGILGNLQKRICKIEGDNEISPGGLSAVFYKICSPSVVHEGHEHSYLNSVCYNMTDDLQQNSSFTPAFKDCTEKTVDLVFLFDGSGSMTGDEFNKNKDFIVDIMNNLKNTSVKFAAVQFSMQVKKVFDFNDYEAGRALDKLMKEPHMKALTNTHKALKFVLEEIFENPDAGASPDATQVVVLITDGDPTDTDKKLGIIKRYDDKNIIRIVIGVRDARLDKFRAIASEPKDQHAYKIENYDGLTGILGNLQKRICKIEGSKMARGGFSAVFYKDNLILGSVRSNSWRGEDPRMQMDSYLGYSISVGEKNNAPLYFTGKPRHESMGQVVLLRQDGKNWTAAQTINGDQAGSYFGAELCSVDVDSDINTDFLLVGAPLFNQSQEKREGQIYIYMLTDEMQLRSVLNVTAPSTGRFGTTISSLADLNGDGLRDVAVGAPLEDDNRGVVYIFLGDRYRGIRDTFSQRIMGQKITPELRFFGQAIDGDNDLGEDGLPDIVVGSKGMTVVLRSRPVFDVLTHLSFQPLEISTEKIDCMSSADENLPMVILTSCFEMLEITKSKEAVSSGLSISYTLEVDPMRQTHRGFFSQTDKKARNLTSTYELRNEYNCSDHPIYMPICVDDTSSPVSIRLNFFQVDSENATAVLNMDSKTQVSVEVPFQK